MSGSNLRVSAGQPIEARHHNGLVSLAGELQIQQGRIKGRRAPDGFTPMIDVKPITRVDHAFKVALGTDEDENDTATIAPGFIAGLIPRIGDLHLDETDDDGNAPTLIIPKTAWKKGDVVDRALLMFRYDLDHTSFAVNDVEAVAVAEVPAAKPWTWHKLIAFLTRNADGDVTHHQALFFDQYFETSDRRANGFFHAWPRIA